MSYNIKICLKTILYIFKNYYTSIQICEIHFLNKAIPNTGAPNSGSMGNFDFSGEKITPQSSGYLTSILDQPCAPIPTSDVVDNEETMENNSMPILDIFINPRKRHILQHHLKVVKKHIKDYIDSLNDAKIEKVEQSLQLIEVELLCDQFCNLLN